MTLQEILDKCRSLLDVCEERYFDEEYCELVFYSKEINEWNKLFTTILGPARKPKGVKPSEGDLYLTKSSGGIRVEQTLFEREFGNVSIVAKFWPWDDNVHTTMKMALLIK
jgi:hypothetical protein